MHVRPPLTLIDHEISTPSCRIHQPSAELFSLFDRVLLLGKNGKTSYFGDIGEGAQTLLEYFQSHGARVCGRFENP